MTGKNGVVVSQTTVASEIGRDILEQGGNAVDAAIATAFALAVSWPEAGNIAGGGFMMVAPVDGDVVCVEYREKAPASVNKNSFIGWTQMYHPRMIGVPGTVHGMFTAHQKFGRLPWKSLVMPSVEIAKNGFIVDGQLAYSLNLVLRLKSIQTEKTPCRVLSMLRTSRRSPLESRGPTDSTGIGRHLEVDRTAGTEGVLPRTNCREDCRCHEETRRPP